MCKPPAALETSVEMAEAGEGLQIGVPAPSVTASPACPSAPEARGSRCVVRLDLPPDWGAGAFRIMGHGAWRGNEYLTDAHLHAAADGQCGRRCLPQPGAEAHHLKIFLCVSVSPSVKRRDFTRSALPQQWDWRFFSFFRLDRAGLKDRGERIPVEWSAPGNLGFSCRVLNSTLTFLHLSVHATGLGTFSFFVMYVFTVAFCLYWFYVYNSISEFQMNKKLEKQKQ